MADELDGRPLRRRRVGRQVDRVLQRRRALDGSDRSRSRSSSSGDESEGSLGGGRGYSSHELSSSDEDRAAPSSGGEVDNEDEERSGADSSPEQSGDEIDEEGINEDEMDDSQFLREVLRRWASEGGAASMRKLDELLLNLAVRFNGLPLSYKTLLGTPRRVEVTPLHHGSILWYKGIRESLDGMNLEEYLVRYRNITIDINMDGQQLSRSSDLKFWPILGWLVGSENPPFVIGIYLGKKDPDDVYAYLHNLALELNDLQQAGYLHNGNFFPFAVRNYILDAPARAFIKCCVLFNSYYACEKCCVKGVWIEDRMTFSTLDAALRTDESYNNQEQPLHHMGISPLQEIGTGMVSQFRLDPLHLVYIGVFKRFLEALLYWHGNFSLHWTTVNAISQKLESLNATRPSDFNREVRGLKQFKHFKATEFRRMCHYDSILVLRDYVNINVYRHFLLLYVGLYILAHPVWSKIQYWRDYAHEMLVNFINHSIEIYGEKFVVYNVHCLSHLAKECADQNVSLIEFSAFKFECFLAVIKAMLKSFHRPCQQAACRLTERMHFVQDVKLPPEGLNVSPEMEYVNEDMPGRHFRKITIGNFTLQINGKDHYFKSRDEDVVILEDIVQNVDGTVQLIGKSFLQKNDFFEYPLPSSHLGIYSVANLDNQAKVFELTDVAGKCWLMPDGDSFCCVPILHTSSH